MLEVATAIKPFDGEPDENHYLQYILEQNNVPYYEPSVMGDDTRSEMGSVVDYANMERELNEMIIL